MIKYFIRNGIKAAIAFVGALLLVSCTKEDNIDCALSLQFFYVKNLAHKDFFSEQVSMLDLFVYDVNEQYVTTLHIEKQQFMNGNKVKLPLPLNTYHVVAWGNLTYQFDCPATPALRDLRLMLNHDGEHNSQYGLPGLFHGFVTVTPGLPSRVSMTKNTNLIRVTIDDLFRSDYTVSVTGSNGTYSYENTPYGINYKYHPRYVTRDGSVTFGADLTVLRLLSGDDTRLIITDVESGMEVCNQSLTGLLLRNPDINTNDDFDARDEYDITITIRNSMTISITINGWVYVLSEIHV